MDHREQNEHEFIIHSLDWKVDNCWIFLQKERIFGESLDVQYDKRR